MLHKAAFLRRVGHSEPLGPGKKFPLDFVITESGSGLHHQTRIYPSAWPCSEFSLLGVRVVEKQYISKTEFWETRYLLVLSTEWDVTQGQFLRGSFRARRLWEKILVITESVLSTSSDETLCCSIASSCFPSS